MTKIDDRVAGLFRRGLPQGDQLDLLTTWLVLKLTNGESGGMKLLTAINASIDRATAHLSERPER